MNKLDIRFNCNLHDTGTVVVNSTIINFTFTSFSDDPYPVLLTDILLSCYQKKKRPLANRPDYKKPLKLLPC